MILQLTFDHHIFDSTSYHSMQIIRMSCFCFQELNTRIEYLFQYCFYRNMICDSITTCQTRVFDSITSYQNIIWDSLTTYQKRINVFDYLPNYCAYRNSVNNAFFAFISLCAD